MSDNLLDFGVELSFDKVLKDFNKFKKSVSSFNTAQKRMQQNQLKAKHTLLAASLKKEQLAFGKSQNAMTKMVEAEEKKRLRIRESYTKKGTSTRPASVTPVNTNTNKTSPLSTAEKDYNKVQAALTKTLEKEEKKRQRIIDASAKGSYRRGQADLKSHNFEQSSRRRQAVAGITAPTGAGDMQSFYKQQEQAADKLAKVEERRVRALEKAKHSVLTSSFMLKENVTAAEKLTQETIKRRVTLAKTTEEVRHAVRLAKANTSELRKQNYLMSRMKDSSSQMAGNMVSAFAVMAGFGVVTRIGQDFEGVNSSLLAITGSSEEAGKELAFVRAEALRLGKPLKDSAKSFTRMKAAQGDLSDEQVRNIFTSVQEMGTVLGVSADEANRANVAIGQMMSKGTVSAEELKGQLAEAGFANAIPEMVKAAQDIGIIDKSLTLTEATKAFTKLQEEGKVMSEEILPRFAERLKMVASVGLEEKLKSNRVAMGRLQFAFEDAANSFFKSGFEKGLTSLFNKTADLIADNEDLWKSLGIVIGGVLKGVAFIIDHVISPAFSAFGSILSALTVAFGDFTALIIPGLSPLAYVILPKIVKGLGGVHKAMLALRAFALGTLAPLVLLVATLEEISEFFNPTGKKTLIGSNVNTLTGDQAAKAEAITARVKKNYTPEMKVAENVLSVTQGYGYGGRGNQNPITVNTSVNLDGEKVGTIVMQSEGAQQQVNRQINSASTGNY